MRLFANRSVPIAQIASEKRVSRPLVRNMDRSEGAQGAHLPVIAS
jgi:hypothetical protein